MVPTQRLYALLGLGTAVALGMTVLLPKLLSLGIGMVLTWDVAVLVAALWDQGRVRPEGIQAQRHLPPKLSIGRENPISIQLTLTQSLTQSLRAPRRTIQLQVTDQYPAQLSSPELSRLASSRSKGALSLSPRAPQVLTYSVIPIRRESLTWGAIQLRQLGPWGLAWRQWSVPQTQTTTVYPDLVALRELTIRLALQSTGSLRMVRREGTGTEFAELRDYSSGDDPRLLDWKATARRGRPLVRVLEPEQEQTLMILLDRGRLMTARVQGLLRFDWGLNAALALAKTGLHRGDRVGIGVFDRQMSLWIPPGRGEIQMGRFLKQLSPLQPELIEPDYLAAVSRVTSQQTRRALVVVLTDIIDAIASAELLGALARLSPRYLPLCVALRDPQIDIWAQQASPGIDATYHRAVALDLMTQRRVALAQLKHRGAMVLDAPANQISSALVDQYLRIKARNRL